MARDDAHQPAGAREVPPVGELTSGSLRLTLRGCALQLALWIAFHQNRINEAAPDCGQLILNWKGDHPPSITAEIKTRL